MALDGWETLAVPVPRAPRAAGGGLCRGVALRTPLLARAGGQAASPGARGAVPAGSAGDAPGREQLLRHRRRGGVSPAVQLGAGADPTQGARVATPGCVTHRIMPRKLHHRIAREGTAVFTKHEPEQAPDMLIRVSDSWQETRG